MKFVYASKDMAVSESLKTRVEKKLGKLERYFREEPEATIRFKVQKGARNIVEITVNAAGVILRAEESSNDMYLSIDHAVDKLESQIRRHRTKLEKRIRTAELEPVKEQLTRRIWESTNPDTLTIHDNMGIIATVGRGMVHNPGTAARLFTALSRYHINVRMIDQGSSELSILVGVDSGEFQQAIRAIYDEFVSE